MLASCTGGVSIMDERLELLDVKQVALFKELNALREALAQYTKGTYNRINPFNENLIDWKEKGKLVTGHTNNTIYESCTIVGDVEFGNDCWIGPFTLLDGSGGLTIGSGVTVAANAMIYTHDTLMYTLSEGKMPYEYKPAVIENYVFISTHAIVLKGSHIGHHSLIAANSVVSCKCPPYSILAGTPARIIGGVCVKSDGTVKLEYN